jgi:general nucleoside transport system permease protein
MNETVITGLLLAATVSGVPVLLAALGEAISEQVGVKNLGIEGVMLMGAVLAAIVAHNTGNAWVGLVGGALGAGAFNFVTLAVPNVVLRAEETVVAFACWFIGIGLSTMIGVSYNGKTLPSLEKIEIPLLSDLPYIGPAFFHQPATTYVAIAMVLATSWFLYRTRHGLKLRAIGRDIDAARACGIAVTRLRLAYVTLGGAIIGLGGAVLAIVALGTWETNLTGFRGFLGFALVIVVGRGRIIPLLLGAYLFGLLLGVSGVVQAQGWDVSPEFLDMLPYIAAVLALIVQAWRPRRRLRRRAAGVPALAES